jgi:hypothetical protein
LGRHSSKEDKQRDNKCMKKHSTSPNHSRNTNQNYNVISYHRNLITKMTKEKPNKSGKYQEKGELTYSIEVSQKDI